MKPIIRAFLVSFVFFSFTHAQAQSVNLAAGRTPIASTPNAVNLSSATDGNLYSEASVWNGVQWLQIDLGQMCNIDRIQLWHYFLDTRSYHDVIVQISNVEDFSSGVVTVYNSDHDNSAGQGIGSDTEYVETSAGKEILLSPSVQGRFIRFWSNGNSVNTSNHYSEIEIFGSPVYPPSSTNNLAFGKIPASSALFDQPITNLTDGNHYTYASMATGPQWVKFDLGQSYQIDRIKLWHYFLDTRYYFDVIVQLSNTADFSSNVVNVYNNDRDNSLGQGAGTDFEYTETIDGKEIIIGPAINARYVRFWSTGSNLWGANDYSEVEIYGELPTNPDSDNDGMPDAWEQQYFLTLSHGPDEDFDGDGLTNLQEYQQGTNPTSSDTDSDGVNDGDEVAQGRNPLKGAVSDTNGVVNLQVYTPLE